MNLADRISCNGCMACVNSCPVNAIDVIEDEYGFLYPQINNKKCIQCKACIKNCSLNCKFENDYPIYYAGFADDTTRKNSSSGGIFSLIAENILSSGGYVCGAAFDEKYTVKHIIINAKEDLYKLRTSKYVQSFIGNIYYDIKQLLNNNKKVFFVGTPCQVAGLKNYLNKKYSYLYTADLSCSGVPSDKIFKQYLNEKIGQKTIKSINFRDKKYGWGYEFNFKCELENNEIFELPFSKNSYLTAFNNGLSIRESCYNCKFATLPRVGDITLADFWGIESILPEFNDKKGISLILINNDIGKQIIKNINLNLKSINQEQEEKIFLNNPRLQYPVDLPIERRNFLNNIGKINFDDNYNKNINQKFDIAIMNFWWTSNYGACLTAFALQRTLEEVGYNTRLVKFLYEQNPNIYYNKISDKFARKYLKTTRLYSSKNELKELNNLTDKFIVGSDQVFRYEYMHDSFMLNFADFNKTKIAFAASFGIDRFNCSKKDFKKYKFLLSRFDNISTREFSGVKILKNKFNINSKQVIDPVFFLENNYWEILIKDSFLNHKNYILSYTLDQNESLINAINEFAKTNDLKIIAVDPIKHSIQDWLYLIKNAKYIITDSYHGLCFSIIFNKNVQCLINSNRGADRFFAIKEILNIPQHVFIEDENINKINFKNIDYSIINKNIYTAKSLGKDELIRVCAFKKRKNSIKQFKDEKMLNKYFKKRIRMKHVIKKILYKVLYKLTKNENYYKKYQKYKQKL